MANGLRVTVRDLARQAGVSPATVSYVLNDKGNIGEATRQRVLQAAAELGYPIDRRASENMHIGVVYPEGLSGIKNSAIYSAFLQGVQNVAGTLPRCVLACLPNTPDSFATHFLAQSTVSGLLLLGMDADHQVVQIARAKSIPCVLLNHRGTEDISSVVAANRHGMALATEHLIREHRCRTLVFTQPTAAHSYSQERLAGFQAAVGSCDDHSMTVRVLRYRESVLELIDEIRAVADRPLGVVADRVTDAAILQRRLLESDVKVPGEVSVVGFDDLEVARQAQPAITTVRFDPVKLAEKATQVLMALIQKELRVAHLELPVDLVVRESCGCRPTEAVAE